MRQAELVAPAARISPAVQRAQIRPSAIDLKLLSHLTPIKKQPQARKPVLSKEARVVSLATAEERMTAMQAIEEANRRGLTLIPNKDIDERLNGKDQIWKAEEQFYPLWTGTFIAYSHHWISLGKTINCTDGDGITYAFPVPKKLRLQLIFESLLSHGIALAINHGFTKEGKPLISYKKISGKKFLIEIADESKMELIKFLGSDFGMPMDKRERTKSISKEVHIDPVNAYELEHNDFNNSVGLLARGCGIYGRHAVVVYRQPSLRFGVLAYARQEPQSEEIQM